MPQENVKTTTFRQLGFEFLRRVVNELNGRKFEQSSGTPSEQICGDAKSDEVLHILPELTREFAKRIKPEWTRCYILENPPSPINDYFIATDPHSGVSIRIVRHFDVMKGDFRYRFDAAFN
jgi:hypothetical protein